ncbi:MAG: type II toxin-antitoxin system VapC family toxin [Planctomycetota bacterium]|nr:type II toxin-antitoxin system VapC family toxin [Planctomycetota bacterium]MDA1140689.1 type II toxin-antitoxin system VapC family toxin [Planctomycetota bacterium]
MIVLDTHIWVWWVHGDEHLETAHSEVIEANEESMIGVSAISCWEVAKLVESGRLDLPIPIDEWMRMALGYPGVVIMELSPRIAIESTRLPGGFHRDPDDQIIVATARVHECALVTSDDKILNYPHVETVR